MTALALVSWFHVAAFLQSQGPGTYVSLRASQVEHPRDAGMTSGLMMPTGQRADYRLDLQGNQQLVVQDFVKYYLARLEKNETRARSGAARHSAPGSTLLGTAALGAMIGLACGRSQQAALAGAALGGLVALAGMALATADLAPRANDAAVPFIRARPHDAASTQKKNSPRPATFILKAAKADSEQRPRRVVKRSSDAVSRPKSETPSQG